jgi:predicted Zn-dependent protease
LGLAIINAGLGAAGVQNADTWAGILGTGVQYGVLLPYSREHELEADRLGVQYMAAARYNPVEALSFWQGLSSSSNGAPPELLSTHPSSSSRMSALGAQLRSMGYSV